MALAACIQINGSSDIERNLAVTERLVREAAAAGARLIATPEATTYLGPTRTRRRGAGGWAHPSPAGAPGWRAGGDPAGGRRGRALPVGERGAAHPQLQHEPPVRARWQPAGPLPQAAPVRCRPLDQGGVRFAERRTAPGDPSETWWSPTPSVGRAEHLLRPPLRPVPRARPPGRDHPHGPVGLYAHDGQGPLARPAAGPSRTGAGCSRRAMGPTTTRGCARATATASSWTRGARWSPSVAMARVSASRRSRRGASRRSADASPWAPTAAWADPCSRCCCCCCSASPARPLPSGRTSTPQTPRGRTVVAGTRGAGWRWSAPRTLRSGPRPRPGCCSLRETSASRRTAPAPTARSRSAPRAIPGVSLPSRTTS